MESKGKWETLVRRLEALLRLKTFPVAIKLLEDPEELARNKWARRPKKLTLCQLISIVRTFDWTVGVTADDFPVECASIVGLVDFNGLPEELRNGTFRSLLWCKTREDGRRFEETIPRIPAGRYKAIMLAPLVYDPFDPDIVLIYANPAQMILIINALQFEDYERLQFFCVGESSCSDAIAQCYLSSKPSLTIPCYGERRYGHAQDDELVMGLLPKDVEKAERNLEELYKRGICYPVSYAGSQLDISPVMPLSYQQFFGQREGIEGVEVPLRKITRW
jgi:uncharacterized protein (DUF169 family)